jgi:hypothetical protein
MNDMSAPFTNCPESELAYVPTTASNPAWGVSLSARGLPRRLNLGNIRHPSESETRQSMPRGDYRRSYAVFVTVAVTRLSVARPARSYEEGLETRATAFRQLTDPLLFLL